MKMKLPAISVKITKQKTIINHCQKEFRSCREIFPLWITSFPILEDWHKKIGNLDCLFNIRSNTGGIGFILPLVEDLITGELIDQIETFPEEERTKVRSILMETAYCYLPDNTKKYIGRRMDEQLRYEIKTNLKNTENEILNLGGRTPLKELKFRLGLSWY